MLGQLLAFFVALIPAGIVFALVFFLSKTFVGTIVALFVSLLMASVVLAVEAALGVVLLGWLFERLDLSAS